MGKFFAASLLFLISMSVTAQNRILIVGDSISAGFGLDNGQEWAALLQKKLQAEQLNYQVVNASISGDTTAGGLARIEKLLVENKPQWVLIELGANDGLRGLSPKEMKKNLAQSILLSQKTGAKVLLLEVKIPPNYGKRYLDEFSAVYSQLSTELDVPFVPSIMEDVALHKELMQKDLLHPNALAQPLLLNKIWQTLKSLLYSNTFAKIKVIAGENSRL
ncbi:MAG: arylesterase [Methylococcaceae bacterium]|nr:arylesterase [Methylococcaceae bacterium]